MTTRPRRQIATLTPAESYNAAIQLHNQEFRTLGARVNAFLLSQSILVIALVSILVHQQLFPYALIFIMWIIIVAGILFCFFHYLAGKLGSQGAFRWRRYMRKLEGQYKDAPWNWFYKDAEYTPFRRRLLDKLPLPIVWIIAPGIFAGIWFSVSFYITYRLFMPGDPIRSNLYLSLFTTRSLSITITVITLGVLIYIIIRAIVWWHHSQR